MLKQNLILTNKLGKILLTVLVIFSSHLLFAQSYAFDLPGNFTATININTSVKEKISGVYFLEVNTALEHKVLKVVIK